jgi:hypothetical protein
MPLSIIMVTVMQAEVLMTAPEYFIIEVTLVVITDDVVQFATHQTALSLFSFVVYLCSP